MNFLLSYLSKFMTLLPGDIITTGTPPGIGNGKKPPIFLKSGDEVRLSISELGEQKQKVR
jgi:2-keto-4-pentenoate hydratase/2-oxohepta-3-ene-1,7-dioic acid hydratase in catechol pathway